MQGSKNDIPRLTDAHYEKLAAHLDRKASYELRSEYVAMFECLTATQTRCTELRSQLEKLAPFARLNPDGSIDVTTPFGGADSHILASTVKEAETAAGMAHLAMPAPGILLPGWTCACGCFNGNAKEVRTVCRACDLPMPAAVLEDGIVVLPDMTQRVFEAFQRALQEYIPRADRPVLLQWKDQPDDIKHAWGFATGLAALIALGETRRPT